MTDIYIYIYIYMYQVNAETADENGTCISNDFFHCYQESAQFNIVLAF